MSTATKIAGINGFLDYTLNRTPFSAPVLRLYSDPARTILVAGPTTGTATANPNVFTFGYSAALPAGDYFPIFSTVFTSGQPALDDSDDMLLLVSPSGSIGSSSGPCAPWITTDDLCGACADTGDFDATMLDRSIAAATDFCFESSGRRFPGVCTKTIRPCADEGESDIPADMIAAPGSYGMYAGNIGWQQFMALGGSCSCDRSRQCGCTRLSEILLNEFHPVTSVIQVRVDGVILDPTYYRIDDLGYLVRLNDADGTNPGWPCCSDVLLADTEPNTFSVAFSSGTAPPALGILAAAALACEYALACAGSADCRLPAHVQSVARQGVSMSFGALGVRAGEIPFMNVDEVDGFLAAFAPSYRSGWGGFTSVDAPNSHRVTG